MAKTTRQTAIFGVEDWKRLYQTYREADFQSYDFETLRKSFVDYLRLYYPETFNDFTESSEFIALLDVMAFMGQALAFRNDLNTRENFLDTAERRDSVVRLANLVSYTAKRNTAAQGYLKVDSISTTENIIDFNGINLANISIDWDDAANPSWFEQFTAIVNAALVPSQKYGRPANRQSILGVDTSEYTVRLVPGYLPVVPYSTVVDGINMPFEAVTATSQGRDYVYEPAPKANGEFNLLYRNDNLGFGSNNTGFFLLFKQGVLQDQTFNLTESVPNRTVNINIEGVNQEDRWLFQLNDVGTISREWTFVENIYSAAIEQISPDARSIYAVTSRSNDQITLSFGDGVFAEIPVGQFRCYVRSSNGLEYIINPEEMQNISIPLTYVSRTGRLETLTLACSITAPVSNAQSRETIDEIKQRAPARYYTQNRMVNGEDYNNFPFTRYNSIIKSKAVARSSIGVGRYVDLTDVTGKYSSTNIYASDGVLYRQDVLPTFDFTWTNRNDIVDVINNQIEPILTGRGMLQFYYQNFTRPDLTSLNLQWNQSTVLANQATGFFYSGAVSSPSPIGDFTSGQSRYIQQGALVRFVPPSGFYFNKDNRLVAGQPQLITDKLELWATPTQIINDGTNQGQGNFSSGQGPVSLNNNVPSTAFVSQVIPIFVTDLPTLIEQSMLTQIELFRDFGLGYNNATSEWYVITSFNLDKDSPFSLQYAGNTTNAGLDASWLLQFVTDGQSYVVTSRGLDYLFSSVIETRFISDENQRIYDPRTDTVIKDFVRVLKTNSQPNSNAPLSQDYVLEIIGQPVQSDGFRNDYEVTVSFRDSDSDGVADDPDFFEEIVAPGTGTNNTALVFFQLTEDFDNLERYLPLANGVVNSVYSTKDDIELVKSEYIDGQLFYARGIQQGDLVLTAPAFYELQVATVAGVITRTLIERTDLLARTGRQSLAFQYRHNTSLSNVIDPGSTNIIDVYLVTDTYYQQYQEYITDSTNSVLNPIAPTIDELQIAYGGLNDYKMISDTMVLNSVTFKPLFGSKAAQELRATIKVVKAINSVATDSEVRSQVIAKINQFFTIDKWDFGDSFYFSELAAYLHQQLGSIVSSVVLVPIDPLKTFGDLYEVRCQPNEIFVSAATVDDVEIISALTQSNIRSQTTVSGIYGAGASSQGSAVGGALTGSTSGTGSGSGGSSGGGGY
jgi:uncharacterized membrane protein YgcG